MGRKKSSRYSQNIKWAAGDPRTLRWFNLAVTTFTGGYRVKKVPRGGLLRLFNFASYKLLYIFLGVVGWKRWYQGKLRDLTFQVTSF
jgi:hypothetical protein